MADKSASLYWNDENQEKKKVFNVVDIGFDKIEQLKKYRALFDQMVNIAKKYSIYAKNQVFKATNMIYIKVKILNLLF